MAVALVAVCIVGGLVIARGKSNAEQTEQAAVVVDVAGKVATDLASISANNAAQQLTVLTAETTGQFHEQIAPYAAALQSTLAQAGANSKAQLTASGLESFADDHATVLVALSATVGNSASPNVETVPYRLAIGLRKVNNRWLADEVSFIK
ncbi:MAG TPA: hypothetical protein VGH89_39600 [Pseudonocardia sp.]